MPAGSELEQLGDELSRRGLKTMLGPQPDGALALDVIRTAYDPRWSRAGRVHWSGGWFRWANGWPITRDLAGAADLIAGTLSARGIPRPRRLA